MKALGSPKCLVVEVPDMGVAYIPELTVQGRTKYRIGFLQFPDPKPERAPRKKRTVKKPAQRKGR